MENGMEDRKGLALARRCASLEPLPEHIKPRYARLALITHPWHMGRLDPTDEDTLIVSCDWLLWQRALAEKRHCVYYELGLLHIEDVENLDTELYLRANDWIYDHGEDVTLFGGVSLGKLFCSDVALCLMNCYRIERSLHALIQRFRPEEILFFDFTPEISVLTRDLRRRISESVARERGIGFTDDGESGPGNKRISENPVIQPGHGIVVRALLFLYSRVMRFATGLRCLLAGRERRVMVVVNTNLAEPMVRNFTGAGLTPIFLARTLPKRPGLLVRCLRAGVLLVNPTEVPLSAADRQRLQAIRDSLDRLFAGPADDTMAVVRAFVRKQVLDSGRLDRIAGEVRKAERLIDRYAPRRVVVDGKRNPPPRIYVELAHARGIAVDYLWHSPLAPQNQKFDALGGDPRAKPLVTRCLSWGAANDAWLDAIEARQPRVRTGCPVSDRYRDVGGARPKRFADTEPGETNVLILQYAPIYSDPKGMNVNMYSHFVEVVRLLRKHGYENIRLKLHPGPGRWKKSYFEDIVDFFDLECRVLKTEPFEECVAWADMVIGPAQTGAMFEALAAGRPYYAFIMPPHTLDPRYYGDYPLFSSVAEFERALGKPPPEGGDRLLNAFYSVDEHPSGSRRLWEVLERDMDGPRPEPADGQELSQGPGPRSAGILQE